jgi:hypothetical protein
MIQSPIHLTEALVNAAQVTKYIDVLGLRMLRLVMLPCPLKMAPCILPVADLESQRAEVVLNCSNTVSIIQVVR